MRDDPELLAEGRYVRLVRRGRWEYAQRTTGDEVVAVVAVTSDEALLLVEQYRPAVRCSVIELPAGLVGDEPGGQDETAADAARRELLEETGYAAERFDPVGSGPNSAGLCSEVTRFYRATALRRETQGGGTDGEDIRVHEVPLRELRSWLDARNADGALVDPKIYAGLCLCGLAI